MTKKKSHTFFPWIFIFIAAALLTAIIAAYKNYRPQSRESSTRYQQYQSPVYGFRIEYPEAWEIRKSTQVFENGDTIAFGISGRTQKQQTELTDGAQVVISKPFVIKTDITTWAKKYFDKKNEFSQNSINGRSFEKIYSCSDTGCMTYYFTSIHNKIYGVATFAEGKEKMVYENAIVYMLRSLQFTETKNDLISKDDAAIKVKALPEVLDYLKRVPDSLIAVNGEENNAYMVQVYEIKDGHTATFNWYTVDKTTGEVKKEFE